MNISSERKVVVLEKIVESVVQREMLRQIHDLGRRLPQHAKELGVEPLELLDVMEPMIRNMMDNTLQELRSNLEGKAGGKLPLLGPRG